jgi:ketosteroid isomerase-like protein
MTADDADRLNQLYRAFNKRDIETLLDQMSADVDWPNAWEGGRVHGRDGVRDYWTRQWSAIDPAVHPLSITKRPDGSVAVRVHQIVRALDGTRIGETDVVHVFVFRDGLIVRMEIEDPGEPPSTPALEAKRTGPGR